MNIAKKKKWSKGGSPINLIPLLTRPSFIAGGSFVTSLLIRLNHRWLHFVVEYYFICLRKVYFLFVCLNAYILGISSRISKINQRRHQYICVYYIYSMRKLYGTDVAKHTNRDLVKIQHRPESVSQLLIPWSKLKTCELI